MPQLGESVVEGTIGKWLVSVGQSVAKDEPIVEILTDKADSELPSPVAGVVTQLLAAEDDIIAVGDPICEIDENAQAGATPRRFPLMRRLPRMQALPHQHLRPFVRLAREQDVDLAGVQAQVTVAASCATT